VKVDDVRCNRLVCVFFSDISDNENGVKTGQN
jgi:hypothetical protein